MPASNYTVSINQEVLQNKFIAYLDILATRKGYDPEYINNLQLDFKDGHCSGFSALWIYNVLNHTEYELFQTYKQISSWNENIQTLTPELEQNMQRIIGYIAVLADKSALIDNEPTTFHQYLGFQETNQFDYDKLCAILEQNEDKVFTRILPHDILFFSDIGEFEKFIDKVFAKLLPGKEVVIAITMMDHAVNLFFHKDENNKQTLRYYCPNLPDDPISDRKQILAKIDNYMQKYFGAESFMLSLDIFAHFNSEIPFSTLDFCDDFHDFTKFPEAGAYLQRLPGDNHGVIFDYLLFEMHQELVEKIFNNQSIDQQTTQRLWDEDHLTYLSLISLAIKYRKSLALDSLCAILPDPSILAKQVAPEEKSVLFLSPLAQALCLMRSSDDQQTVNQILGHTKLNIIDPLTLQDIVASNNIHAISFMLTKKLISIDSLLSAAETQKNSTFIQQVYHLIANLYHDKFDKS